MFDKDFWKFVAQGFFTVIAMAVLVVFVVLAASIIHELFTSLSFRLHSVFH